MKTKTMEVKKITISPNGNRYVTLKESGIPVFRITTCGLVITKFDGDKKNYISIEEVIKFYERELNF